MNDFIENGGTVDGSGGITVAGPQSLAVTEGPGALLSAIVQLARDNSINRETLTLLLDRQERMEDRQAEEEFNIAMAACQAEIEPVTRDKRNDQTKSNYASLHAIVQAVRPIYARHGFSLIFGQEAIEGSNIRITCDVSRGRHTVRKYMDAPPDTLGPKGSPVKTALHGLGSTHTYLRNKLTCGVFNIVLRNDPTDDDGQRGGMRFITDEQADELRAMAKTAKREEGPLLDKQFGGTVRSFEEIEVGQGYFAIKSTLHALIQQQAKKAAI